MTGAHEMREGVSGNSQISTEQLTPSRQSVASNKSDALGVDALNIELAVQMDEAV